MADIEKQIEDLSKYLDRESVCVTEVDKSLNQFNRDLEDVVKVLETRLDDIDRRRAEHQQKIEIFTEQLEALDSDWKMVETSKNEAKAQEEEIKGQLRQAEEKLKKVEAEFITLKEENDSALKMAENIPKLSECKRLMYKISRMTFDKYKERNIRGFVVNTREDDVNSFNFNTENYSAQFISNYVWDLIANGVDEAWKK